MASKCLVKLHLGEEQQRMTVRPTRPTPTKPSVRLVIVVAKNPQITLTTAPMRRRAFFHSSIPRHFRTAVKPWSMASSSCSRTCMDQYIIA